MGSWSYPAPCRNRGLTPRCLLRCWRSVTAASDHGQRHWQMGFSHEKPLHFFGSFRCGVWLPEARSLLSHPLLVKYPIPTVDISVSAGYMVRKVLIHLSQNWVKRKIGGNVYFFKRKNKGFLWLQANHFIFSFRGKLVAGAAMNFSTACCNAFCMALQGFFGQKALVILHFLGSHSYLAKLARCKWFVKPWRQYYEISWRRVPTVELQVQPQYSRVRSETNPVGLTFVLRLETLFFQHWNRQNSGVAPLPKDIFSGMLFMWKPRAFRWALRQLVAECSGGDLPVACLRRLAKRCEWHGMYSCHFLAPKNCRHLMWWNECGGFTLALRVERSAWLVVFWTSWFSSIFAMMIPFGIGWKQQSACVSLRSPCATWEEKPRINNPQFSRNGLWKPSSNARSIFFGLLHHILPICKGP